MKIIIKYFAIFILIAIVIVEIYLRIFCYEQLKTQTFPLIYRPDSLGGYEYIPNVKSKHVSPSYNTKVQSNNEGFFGPDFKLSRDSNIFRIIIADFSYASGGDFIRVMQNMFDKNGCKVEVINCSIDGTDLHWHHYRLIKEKLYKYNANLIIFGAFIPFLRKDYTRECYNGYVLEYASYSKESRQYCINHINKIEKNKVLTGIYDLSYIIRAICKKMVDKYEYTPGSFTRQYIAPYRKKKIISDDIITYTVTVRKTINCLIELRNFLNKRGTELCLFQYFSNEYVNNFYVPILEKYKIPYLLLNISPQYYNQNMRLEHDSHSNDFGYQITGKQFYISLITSNLIPISFLNKSIITNLPNNDKE